MSESIEKVNFCLVNHMNKLFSQPWTLRDLVKIFLVITLVVLFTETIFDYFKFEKFLENAKIKSIVVFSLFILQTIIFLIPLYFFTFKKYGTKLKEFGFYWIGFFRSTGWAVLIFLIFTGFNLLVSLFEISTGYQIPGYQEQQPHLPLFGEDLFSLSFAVLTIIVFAPLAEELFFRGYITQLLGRYYKPLKTIALSGFLFALFHFEFQSFIPLFILGMIISYLFLRTRSLWPGIFFHILNNSIALYAEYVLRNS